MRRPAESLVDALESHTQIIRNLWALEPKAPRSRVRWVLLLAVLAVAGVLALDASVREVARTNFVAARARLTELRHPQAPSPVAAEPAPVVVTAAVLPVAGASSDEVVSAPVAKTPVAAPAAAAPAPRAKKAAARRHKK